MDIEQCEKMLARVWAGFEEMDLVDDLPNEIIFPMVQLQMLLHLYKKLDEINENLIGIGHNQWDRQGML